MAERSDLLAIVTDGPNAGEYEAERLAARMVFTVDRATGRRYVLDEDGDRVEPTEDAYVYEHDPDVGVGWLCERGRGGGCIRTVTYRYAGTLDTETGEFVPATPVEVGEIRREARQRVIAWATGAASMPPGKPAPADVARDLDVARDRLQASPATEDGVTTDAGEQLDIFQALGATT